MKITYWFPAALRI